jgi:hypothetical protein
VSEPAQDKPGSTADLLDSIRRLGREDPEGVRRLVGEICCDAYSGLSRDVIGLAKTLGYGDVELIEAIDCCGLVRTFGFLRLEAERRATAPVPARIM